MRRISVLVVIYLQIYSVFGKELVRIFHEGDYNKKQVIWKMKLDFDHHRNFFECDAYVTEKEMEELSKKGIKFQIIDEKKMLRNLEPVERNVREANVSESGNVVYNVYYTNEMLKEYLINMTAKYPSLTKLHNIGKSVNGSLSIFQKFELHFHKKFFMFEIKKERIFLCWR